MKSLSLVIVAALGLVLLACPPGPASPTSKNACESISLTPIPPGTGSQTICVAPTDCRADTMTTLIDASICSDKSGGSCPAGASACSNACVGQVVSSALKVTSCTWDRNSECQPATGGQGGKCTCAWSIPAGGALQCGCGCK